MTRGCGRGFCAAWCLPGLGTDRIGGPWVRSRAYFAPPAAKRATHRAPRERWHTRAMSHALLLVPEFLLIAAGFAICRFTALGRGVGRRRAARLHLLFPVLLFNSIVRSPLQPGATLGLALAGLAVVGCGIVLGYALRLLPGVDPRLHASGCRPRSASTVHRARARRSARRRAGRRLDRARDRAVRPRVATWPPCGRWRDTAAGLMPAEIVRNPPIIGTRRRLVASLLGLELPAPLATTLQRIGWPALPLGLMAVGAGLRLGELRCRPGLAAARSRSATRCCRRSRSGSAPRWLPPAQRVIAVAFAALSTAPPPTCSRALAATGRSSPVW